MRSNGIGSKKNGILIQQIKLLISKTTLAVLTKVLSQILIYLNDQPLGLLSICQTEDTAKAPSTIKEWELWETAIVLITTDQDVMLLAPITTAK